MWNSKHYHAPDFEKPSVLYKLEDFLKGIVGEKILYHDYILSFDLRGDEHVLDFGCGGGVGTRCVAKFLSADGKVTGVDTSASLLRRAERRLKSYPQACCLHGDIRMKLFSPGSFDVIMIIHVIHDIHPNDRQETISALTRVLKSDGTAFIREPIRTTHGMPVAEIQQLFLRAGFEETKRTVHPNKEYLGAYQLMPV